MEQPFQTACQFNQLDIAKWLVGTSRVNIRSESDAAFIYAYTHGYVDLVLWLSFMTKAYHVSITCHRELRGFEIDDITDDLYDERNWPRLRAYLGIPTGQRELSTSDHCQSGYCKEARDLIQLPCSSGHCMCQDCFFDWSVGEWIMECPLCKTHFNFEDCVYLHDRSIDP